MLFGGAGKRIAASKSAFLLTLRAALIGEPAAGPSFDALLEGLEAASKLSGPSERPSFDHFLDGLRQLMGRDISGSGVSIKMCFPPVVLTWGINLWIAACSSTPLSTPSLL
jgi:hypothetical protein